MALEVESNDPQPEPKPVLTLEIPSDTELIPPSLESLSSIHTRPFSDDSVPPTPATTVETTHSELTTLATTTHKTLPILNVKFAPLPELLPRKRRSSVPLGMAARGQLLRRRSGCRDRNAPPTWTDEGSEKCRRRQEESAARLARTAAYAAYAAARTEEEDEEDEDEDIENHKKKGEQADEDDPLHVLGRMVKVAGKTLWKRVSNKDVAAAATVSTPRPKEDPKGQENSNTGSPTTTQAPRSLPPPLRPILTTISSNITSNVDDHHIEEHEEEEQEQEEGRVWEEEIGGTFPRDISQTETIVEGRAVYSRLASKAEVSSKSPPPTPIILNSKRMPSFIKPPNTKTSKPKLADNES